MLPLAIPSAVSRLSSTRVDPTITRWLIAMAPTFSPTTRTEHETPLDRAARGNRHGRRGRADGFRRRGGPRRVRPDGARGPARPQETVPGRPRLPHRRQTGHPHRAATRSAPTAPTRTASGSVAVPRRRAKVALASRIYVEGRHDAELVEQVWGDDLRVEGVVVEYLGGIDDLVAIVEEFRPGPGRRLGVLVDHLVAGSKEARIAEAVRRGPGGAHTLVVGHPFIDIWQAVKPARLGISAWPVIPKGTDWKRGVCRALGWPHAQQADTARAWQRIRGRVGTGTTSNRRSSAASRN